MRHGLYYIVWRVLIEKKDKRSSTVRFMSCDLQEGAQDGKAYPFYLTGTLKIRRVERGGGVFFLK